MRVQKFITLLLCGLTLSISQTQASTMSAKELGDSLTAYTGFPSFIPKVKVKNLRVNRQNVSVWTNKTLGTLCLSPSELKTLRQHVSRWVLGHEQGSITIYSDGYELGELITDRYKSRANHYTLTPRPALPHAEREWTAPNGLDGRNIALWPSHGIYYNKEQDRWCWQRARMWTMVEDLYSYEFTHTWLIPMLENAGAYVLEPRARAGLYYHTNTANSVWMWLGNRPLPDNAEAKWMGDEVGPSGKPRWMEGARYWLEYTGYPDSIWNVQEWTQKKNAKEKKQDNDPRGYDYKDDLQCRGLWVNYLTGGSRANPKQPGLGIQIDACLALHTDGYTAPTDSEYIGTLAIYTDYDDNHHKEFPTGASRMLNRDFADYVQTQVVEDIRRLVEPQWPRRELNNAGYCESRYPQVPTVLLEILSHKNLADIRLGLDPNFQKLFCRAIYKGLGRWMMGDKFVATPLEVNALAFHVYNHPKELTGKITWQATTDSIEPTATPTFYIVYVREHGKEWDNGTRVNKCQHTFVMKPGVQYDIRVAAGNTGGISLMSETLSARAGLPENTEFRGTKLTTNRQQNILIINADYRVDGPEWFVDSLRAGIVPATYPIPYGVCRTYLGDQWIFDKQRDIKDNGWTDDDNCGWGMCHMDYAGREIIGNTFDFPAQCISLYPQLNIEENGELVGLNIESCSVMALHSPDTTIYDKLVIYLGQENHNLFPQPLRQLIEQHIRAGKAIEIQGAFLASSLNNEEKTWAEKTLGYRLAAVRGTMPTGKRNAPDAIRPANTNGRVVERFPDTGLPCTIQTGNIIITTK